MKFNTNFELYPFPNPTQNNITLASECVPTLCDALSSSFALDQGCIGGEGAPITSNFSFLIKIGNLAKYSVQHCLQNKNNL